MLQADELTAMNTMDITAVQARAVVDAARAKAEQIGTSMDIAVVDAGCNLKRSYRWRTPKTR